MSKKILFIAEAVTLAHVARPLVLAETVLKSGYEVVFACDERSGWLLKDKPFTWLPLQSISSNCFLDALAKGAPVYDFETLQCYVRDDLALIEKVQPDLIVGDFRLSLSVSARITGRPYLAIANAYWSAYAQDKSYPMPSIKELNVLPLSLAEILFGWFSPFAFAWHTRPLNRLRKQYGLPSLGHDLRRVYTDADHVLYVDAPTLIPLNHAPASHHFIGPVLWSMPVPTPACWQQLPTDKPIIYVNLGSSGNPAMLPMILNALADLPVSVIAASAGFQIPATVPDNAFVADYLPGDAAAKMSSLVICNGGAPTTQQALAAGVPVIGIAGNLDQFLNMRAIVRNKAGLLLHGGRTTHRQIREAVLCLLSQPGYTITAQQLMHRFSHSQAADVFASIVSELPTIKRTGS